MGKRNSQLTELLVVAQNDYLTIVDTSAGQSKRVSVKTLVGNVDLGWVATGESWTYSSWTSATRIGVITVPSDATTKYTPGMRTRFSQTTGGTKYGIIVAVSSTTLTVFFPSGTTFNNETITSPVYSNIKVPYGFNASPSLWTLLATSSSSTTAAIANAATSNHGSLSLTVGVGSWRLGHRRTYYMGTASTVCRIYLSTAASSLAGATGYDFQRSGTKIGAGSGATAVHDGAEVSDVPADLTAQTTFYSVIFNGSGASRTIVTTDDEVNAEVSAECAYL